MREQGGAEGEHEGAAREHKGSRWTKQALAREQSGEA